MCIKTNQKQNKKQRESKSSCNVKIINGGLMMRNNVFVQNKIAYIFRCWNKGESNVTLSRIINKFYRKGLKNTAGIIQRTAFDIFFDSVFCCVHVAVLIFFYVVAAAQIFACEKKWCTWLSTDTREKEVNQNERNTRWTKTSLVVTCGVE